MTTTRTARLPVPNGATAYRYRATTRYASRRARLGLTQADVARGIERDQSLVSRFEAGQAVRAPNAERLAGALGLALSEAVKARLISVDSTPPCPACEEE